MAQHGFDLPLIEWAMASRCLLLGLLLGACATQGPARPLHCTFTYGGEAKTVRIEPTNDPYRVMPIEVGSRLAWKVIYVTQPEEESALNIYTYALSDEGPRLIHQAKYKPPYPTGAKGGEFTGIHTLYEPRIGSDLQYGCGWGAP